MFGKSEWFRPKLVGWGLHPVAWQGWAYSLAWIGVIAAPFVALVSRHQAPEALVWLTASLSALGWDVRGLRRELRQGNDPVLYIGEDGTCEQLLARQCQRQAGK